MRYVIGRGLLAAGKTGAGLAAMKRYLEDDPFDPRAKSWSRPAGEPALAPPAQADAAASCFSATPERGRLHSGPYGFSIDWPLTWRVVAGRPIRRQA